MASPPCEASTVADDENPAPASPVVDGCLRSGVELQPKTLVVAISKAASLASTSKLVSRVGGYFFGVEQGSEFGRNIAIPFESKREVGKQNSTELSFMQRVAATRNLAFQDKVREEAEQSLAQGCTLAFAVKKAQLCQKNVIGSGGWSENGRFKVCPYNADPGS